MRATLALNGLSTSTMNTEAAYSLMLELHYINFSNFAKSLNEHGECSHSQNYI